VKQVVLIVCLLAAAGFAFDRLYPVDVIPLDRVQTGPSRAAKHPEQPQISPVLAEPCPAWVGLEDLDLEQRLNARIAFDLGIACPEAWQEAGAIEELWNSGEFDAALERLHRIGRFHDPCDIMVGMSWRVPILTQVGTDWGDNVRIGNRDTFRTFSWDKKNGRNSIALCAGQRVWGSNRILNIYLTTDGGLNWSETFNATFSGDADLDIASLCFGNYYYVVYARDPDGCIGRVTRFSVSTGQQVELGNDSLFATVFVSDTSVNDTIQEIELCSRDDEYPGSRIYCTGRTRNSKLLWGWSDSNGYYWRGNPDPGYNFVHQGRECAYNEGAESAYVWVSWIFHSDDTTYLPAVANLKPDGWHASAINLPFRSTWSLTGLAAYHDSVFVPYTHFRGTGGNRYGKYIVTYNAGEDWYYGYMPDTTIARENPSATGRHGLGLHTAWRQYGDTTDRYVTYFHAGMRAVGWQGPDTINDFQPNAVTRPEVEFVSQGGVHGMVYLKWYDPPNPWSLWFNRSNWTGLAQSPATRRNPARLQARTAPGRVRLAFDNPKQGVVELAVYDPAGRLVHRDQESMGPGPQEFSYAGRTAGVHFAVVRATGLSATAKFTVAR
jgi:hypothetical protein